MNRLDPALRIAMISRSDASGGGAGRVADELARLLRERGHHVDHLVRVGLGGPGQVVLPKVRGDVLVRNLIDVDAAGPELVWRVLRGGYDVAHFHDHVVAFGLRAARVIAARVPSLFTLHDWSGITGGCLYPAGCERYLNGCGGCPQVGTWPLALPLDRTASTFRRNGRLAAVSRVRAITPSRWLADEARRGAWAGRRVDVVPNAVDVDTFVPANRGAGRDALGCGGAPVVLMVASELPDRRKGLDLLRGAWPEVRAAHHDARLVLVGGGDPGDLPDGAELIGPVRDKSRLAVLYAGADLLAIPSREDNLPCTIAESMASGTPAAGTRVGGIPEMIDDGDTGTLAEPESSAAFADAVLRGLASLRTDAARQRAAQVARARWSPAAVTDAYEALYRG